VIIGHNIFVILLIVIRKLPRFAEFDAASTEAEQFRCQHLIPLRSAAEKDPVAARMRHSTFFDPRIKSADSLNGSRRRHRRLGVGVAMRIYTPVGVLEA
jgi:hypothetical protein